MIQFFSERRFQVVFILFTSVLLLLGRQLDVGLTNFDDAFYAQKAKEIFDSENIWVVTYFGGPSFENPPLIFWLMGLAYKIFGVSTYAAVFFPAVLGVVTIYLTYRMALYLYQDTWVAFFAAFILLFPGMFLDGARRAMLDVPLACFVTAALFALHKALKDPRYYWLYGAMTACGILTKSFLGFWPLVIGAVYLFWRDRLGAFRVPQYWGGVALALVLGCFWYLVNWIKFGDVFVQSHFGRQHMTLIRSDYFDISQLKIFLGYGRDFLKTYWPWLPFTLGALWVFARKAFIRKEDGAALLWIWAVLVFVVMSTSKNQTQRYIFMIFPALAIMTAKTLSDWLTESTKEKLLPVVVGTCMLSMIVVNATPIKVKVTLAPRSVDARHLAPIINLNVPPGQSVRSYRLTRWNPKHVIYFFSDRNEEFPIQEPEELFKAIEEDPRSTWLTATFQFDRLQNDYPGRFYVIQANKTYTYFTAMENRDHVTYDYRNVDLPVVK